MENLNKWWQSQDDVISFLFLSVFKQGETVCSLTTCILFLLPSHKQKYKMSICGFRESSILGIEFMCSPNEDTYDSIWQGLPPKPLSSNDWMIYHLFYQKEINQQLFWSIKFFSHFSSNMWKLAGSSFLIRGLQFFFFFLSNSKCRVFWFWIVGWTAEAIWRWYFRLWDIVMTF